jgi:hypothetical protein
MRRLAKRRQFEPLEPRAMLTAWLRVPGNTNGSSAGGPGGNYSGSGTYSGTINFSGGSLTINRGGSIGTSINIGGASQLSAANQNGVAFNVTEVEIAKSGKALLLSSNQNALFVFDPALQTLSKIQLSGSPTRMAYSSDTNTVYIAKTGGTITKINLSVAQPVEETFVIFPGTVDGLVAVGSYLFVAKGSTAYTLSQTPPANPVAIQTSPSPVTISNGGNLSTSIGGLTLNTLTVSGSRSFVGPTSTPVTWNGSAISGGQSLLGPVSTPLIWNLGTSGTTITFSPNLSISSTGGILTQPGAPTFALTVNNSPVAVTQTIDNSLNVGSSARPIISQFEMGLYTLKDFVWSEVNQKLYFVDSYSNLVSLEINENGTAYPNLAPGAIGAIRNSPAGGNSAYGTVAVSPDGSYVAVGSGQTFDATTLELRTATVGTTPVSQEFRSLAWLGSDLISLEGYSFLTYNDFGSKFYLGGSFLNYSGNTTYTVVNGTISLSGGNDSLSTPSSGTTATLRKWNGDPLAVANSTSLSGSARAVVPLSGNRLLCITVNSQGVPQFYVLNADLQLIPGQNPVADAQVTRTYNNGHRVALDGTNSKDPDQSPGGLTYHWTVASGPSGATIVNDTAAQPEFRAVANGDYVVQLEVSDGTYSHTDTVAITVADNRAPVASYYVPSDARVGDSLQLSGTSSSDVDNDPLTYQWTIVAAPAGVTTTNLGTAGQVNFQPTAPGHYTIEFVVSDGMASDTKSIEIDVKVNTPPVASLSQTSQLGRLGWVPITAAGSTDADGDYLNYSWSVTSPSGSYTQIYNSYTRDNYFYATQFGTYTVQLTVGDGRTTDAKTMQVLVLPEHPAETVLALGAKGGENSKPLVKVFDTQTGVQLTQFLAYRESFDGGVRVAVADLTGDGEAEIITAPGPGSSNSQIRVFDLSGNELTRFRTNAFPESFTGGVFVAAGDVNGDGWPDLVATAGEGRKSDVRVWLNRNGATGDPFTDGPNRTFLAFEKDYHGGAMVAAGDLNGDGKAEIVVGSGAGRAPSIRAFDLTQFARHVDSRIPDRLWNATPSGGSSSAQGFSVAIGNVIAGGSREVLVGSLATTDTKGFVYSGEGDRLRTIDPKSQNASLYVAVKHYDSDADLEMYAAQSKGQLSAWSSLGSRVDDVLQDETDFRSGFYVA